MKTQIKLLALVAGITTLALPLAAQTNTFPASGNVGIGTLYPGHPLVVKGDESALDFSGYAGGRMEFYENGGHLGYRVRGLAGGGWRWQFVDGNNNEYFGVDYPSGDITARRDIFAGGNVGIGTTSPEAPLHVQVKNLGLNIVAGFHNLNASQNQGNAVGIGFLNAKNGAWWKAAIVHERTGAQGIGALRFLVNGDEDNSTVTLADARMSILPDGNVGIGTTNPTYPLTVNGAIRAKEIIVDTGWADDVFSGNYKLLSLAETASYIKNAGHLPGMPSAKQVQDKGVSVGEAQTLLLRKIEELTLHMIQMEKRVSELEAENAALRNK